MNDLGFIELLTQTCTYQRRLGVNKYNEPEFDIETDKRCFISYKKNKIKTLTNEEIITTLEIFLDNSFEPNIGDSINGQDIKQFQPIDSILDRNPIGWKVLL